MPGTQQGFNTHVPICHSVLLSIPLLAFLFICLFPPSPSVTPPTASHLRAAGPMRLNEFFTIHLSLELSEPPECCYPLSCQCPAQTPSHWSHRGRRPKPRARPQGHCLVVRVVCDGGYRGRAPGCYRPRGGPDFIQGQRSRLDGPGCKSARLATALPPTSQCHRLGLHT